MKNQSSSQATPRTNPSPLADESGEAWDEQLDYPVVDKDPEADPALDAAGDEELQPDREEKIAIIAYYKAERRGFANSGELEDWLAAEREVDERRLADQAEKSGER